jgi:hypothetical protein
MAMKKEETLLITGADSAILGWVSRCGDVPIVIYSYEKLVKHFKGQGMTEDEAAEWVSVNVIGAWMGKGTPGVLHRGNAADVREAIG